MDTAEARVEAEILDSIQVARGRVPIREFRLLPDCEICAYYSEQPAIPTINAEIRDHARQDHADLIQQ